MAKIDSLDILSDRQTIDGTVYSDKAKIIGLAPNDWGEGGMQRYVTVLAHGVYNLGASLIINLIGYTEEDMSDQKVICTSGPILAADIIEGWRTNLAVHTSNFKYKYVCLQYIAEGCPDSAADHKDAEALCPTSPVLEVPDPLENTFSAWLTVGIDSFMEYPYVNQDNITA